MDNPPQPSLGYSVAAITPPDHPDTSISQHEKSPVPLPFSSPVPPRFPPPRLQQDQIASPLLRTPNLQSPANGVKTGSPAPHMSTPPGPPVFSSPIRPAAVPFRSSPASPQPVAYSSGSSLPTSSPPHFSNGSVELQHQVVPHVTEDALPAWESPYVLFSAQKVTQHARTHTLSQSLRSVCFYSCAIYLYYFLFVAIWLDLSSVYIIFRC